MPNEIETILESIATTCSCITKANGFDYDVQDVLRKFVLPDPSMNCPIIMVLGGSQVYDDDMGDYTNVDLKVIIRGYSQDKSEPEKALQGLITNVLKVLNDSNYNSLQVRPVRTDTDEGWLNVDIEGMGMFDMEMQIFGRFDRSDP